MTGPNYALHGHTIRHVGHVFAHPSKRRPYGAQRLHRRSLLEAAGVEPYPHSEDRQVVDSAKRQERKKRYMRQFEVHGGYTNGQAPIDFTFGARGAAK